MKQRLDVLLVRRGLFPSRERAKAEILAGHILLDGAVELRPGRECPEDAGIAVTGETLPYVSRGGRKLERALEVFGVDPRGRVCLDCGASTGGFTDCLLQRGAERVYALDVGSSQLAPSLRADRRVVSMERFNVRDLKPGDLPEQPSLVTVDVSFISLRLVLPAIAGVLPPDGELICLIKPQFEAGRARLGKRGVVRDRETQRQVLEELLAFFPALGLYPRGLTWSPIPGAEGNVEFLCHLRRSPGGSVPEPRMIVEEARCRLK